MELRVNIKQIGAAKQRIEAVPFTAEGEPGTVGELIAAAVTACVKEYNARAESGESKPQPLAKQQITDLAEIGKIAFGINYGGKKADLARALETAAQAFEDGLFRLFINDTEAVSADEAITLSEGDTLTFIRLTMLAGRMW